jgi:nucleoside-diphosphate-sugar epimerase
LNSVHFDVIVNCTDVTGSAENNVRDCLDTLYDLTANAAKGKKKPLFIFTSGILMYGDGGRVGESGFRGLSENCPYKPHEGAKFRIPVVEELFSRTDLLTCVMLPSFIYGRSSSYYAPLFHQAKTSDVLTYPGCPTSVRHGVHVDDVAAAYVLAAKRPDLAHRQKFNIAGDNYDTFEEILTTISKEFGGKHKIEFGGGKGETVGTISQWMVTEKIKRILGWKPVKPSFREGIKEFVQAWEASKVDGFINVRA